MPKIKRVKPGKRTTKAVFSSMDENTFAPGWDRNFGGQQSLDHIADRERMGQKMTPTGRGTLKRG